MKKANVEKSQDTTTDKNENWFTRGIIGIRDVLIISSIVFSTVVIFMGSDNLATQICTAPMALWAIYKTFTQFTKQ